MGMSLLGRSRCHPGLVFPVICASLIVTIASAAAADSHRRTQARALEDQLTGKVLPYWFNSAVDRERGGYVLADDGTGGPDAPAEKQLVSQARMIWGFSLAHRKGYSDARHDYLEAAAQGYRFLTGSFLDREHGGYYWTTDLGGKPLNRRKIVYGEAFVIYGFVEYFRASRDREALDRAMDLYRVLQKHAYDPEHGGWVEHFTEDWTPLLSPSPEAIVEVAGFKSANTHLHLMEALTELYAETGDRAVRKSLEESLRLNMKYFYPKDAGRSCFHRQLDWGAVTNASSAGLSYGHNVEFAWLMVRAQKVLGQTPAWPHFHAHVEHALRHGYDHQLGGVYNRGFDDQPANNTDKIWWVQSEMLAALTDGLSVRERRDYNQALDSLLDWIARHQSDPRDGIWYDTVAADGSPKGRAKAHNWKANYHDVRAIVKFIDAFGGK